MRIFCIQGASVRETDRLPDRPLERGFYWVGCTREELESRLPEFQAMLQATSGVQLLDLHISDLLNRQLPSHFDYTSEYDVLVFRRLKSAPPPADAAGPAATGAPRPVQTPSPATASLASQQPPGIEPVLRRIETSPVAFAIFDEVLLSVHPSDCSVRDYYATRLLNLQAPEPRTPTGRLPASPADLMLRLVNQMVDAYLDLRRVLNRALDHWQIELLNPKSRVTDWRPILDARLSLHHLDEICEDQRAAVQDWIDSLEGLPEAASLPAMRERELLLVRSRDVLEHIERVVHHVRRAEQSAETTVQMHFSVQSNRTNDIMRTLTALTAVFLPLNLIAGIFGMNFEFIPLTHKQDGFWLAMTSMGIIFIALTAFFWRKHYLARTGR